MLKIISDGLGFAQGNSIRVNSGPFKVKSFSFYIANSNTVTGLNVNYLSLFTYPDYFIIRSPVSSPSLDNGKCVFLIDGEFNCDMLSVPAPAASFGRVEIRNENDVLIADNGRPWADGTYPPDAKNRAGLAGLHAAPAVINPELETALMGDETNKERVQE